MPPTWHSCIVKLLLIFEYFPTRLGCTVTAIKHTSQLPSPNSNNEGAPVWGAQSVRTFSPSFSKRHHWYWLFLWSCFLFVVYFWLNMINCCLFWGIFIKALISWVKMFKNTLIINFKNTGWKYVYLKCWINWIKYLQAKMYKSLYVLQYTYNLKS